MVVEEEKGLERQLTGGARFRVAFEFASTFNVRPRFNFEMQKLVEVFD